MVLFNRLVALCFCLLIVSVGSVPAVQAGPGSSSPDYSPEHIPEQNPDPRSYDHPARMAAANNAIDLSEHYKRIYQVRVVSMDAGGKSSIGSGFQISADGLVVTNYHVVSDFVNSPGTYQITSVANDGQSGKLELLDFDVVADLAILRHPQPEKTYLPLADTELKRGDVAYALGNPGDWGVVMVPGPTNGFVEHSYEKRVLFSGSLNPGMSGGPSLNEDGEVIGVNVATAGSQLSFLVPVDKVRKLLARQRELPVDSYQTETAAQIKLWQRPRLQQLIDADWRGEEFAERQLFGEIRNDFQCWGDTNDTDDEREVARVSKSCSAGDDLYIGSDLHTGQIEFSFKSMKPVKLNSTQFARSLRSFMTAGNRTAYRHSTNFRCDADFILGDDEHAERYQRVITCIRAYKSLPGLYDSVVLVQDRASHDAFIAQLSLAAVERDQIMALNRRFILRSLFGGSAL